MSAILPYCDGVHFYGNESGFVEAGEYRNGSVITQGGYVPEWISELKQFTKNA